MSKILCSFPGRVGDVLWSLPTCRAIAAAAGAPVDFCFSVGPGSGQTEDSRMAELLMAQPYIRAAWSWPEWRTLQNTQIIPVLSAEAAAGYRVINLHYCGWPKVALAKEINDIARIEMELPPLRLEDPWITAPPNTGVWEMSTPKYDIVVGFSDEHAELKAGLLAALCAEFEGKVEICLLAPPGGSRLTREWNWEWLLGGPWMDESYEAAAVGIQWRDLREAARIISAGKVFVGCLSSLAVLAAGLGKPRVLMEPSPARHNEIFQHPGCPLVMGNDGKPTYDARALVTAVKEKLGGTDAKS